MKNCDHCGTPAKTRVPVMIDGSVRLVGTGCAGKFKRAKRSDLFRSLYEANYMAIEDDLLEQYPQYAEQIEYFKERDPSGNLKYLKWEVYILKSGQALAPEIADVVDLFHKYGSLSTSKRTDPNDPRTAVQIPILERKDLYSYKSEDFTDLRDRLMIGAGLVKEKKEKTKTYKEKPPSSEEAPIVYGGDDTRFSVVHIRTKKASMSYGRGTKWCITMGMQGYWEDHESNNDVFFFIIDKYEMEEIDKGKDPKTSDPLYKIAAQVNRDVNDNVVGITFWNALNQTAMYIAVEKYIGSDFLPVVDTIIPISRKWPKSILARLGTGIATTEECSQIFSELKFYKSDSIRNSVLNKLANYSKTDNSILKDILHMSFSEYDKNKKLINLVPSMTDVEFTKFRIESKLPPHATRESTIEVLGSEIYTISKTIKTIVASKGLSGNARVPFNEIDKIIGKYEEINKFVASDSPKLSKKTMLKLLGYNETLTMVALAERKDLPSFIVNKLAKSDKERVRIAAVSNPNIDSSIVNEIILTTNSHDLFRSSIGSTKAKMKNIIDRYKKCLAGPEGWNWVCNTIYCHIANKDKTGKYINEMMKSNKYTRRSLAECDTKNISIDNWKKLSSDEDSETIELAAGNDNNPLIDLFVDEDKIATTLLNRYSFDNIYREPVEGKILNIYENKQEVQNYIGKIFRKLAKKDIYDINIRIIGKLRYDLPRYLNITDYEAILDILLRSKDEEIVTKAEEIIDKKEKHTTDNEDVIREEKLRSIVREKMRRID